MLEQQYIYNIDHSPSIQDRVTQVSIYYLPKPWRGRRLTHWKNAIVQKSKILFTLQLQSKSFAIFLHRIFALWEKIIQNNQENQSKASPDQDHNRDQDCY